MYFRITGYTGFVPRSRDQLGLGYPIITHLALNEFTDDLRAKSATQASEGVQVDRSAPAMMHGKPIYPVETGLVPHYTGHIPGMDKFIDLSNIIKNIKMNINTLLL